MSKHHSPILRAAVVLAALALAGCGGSEPASTPSPDHTPGVEPTKAPYLNHK